ncbi:MAG TPA: lipocalin family protein [Candidatus Sphingobacterium stercoripullorum]|nr:lipocalin family protein [Candidatus Sphingobacterium stercoripullorum]
MKKLKYLFLLLSVLTIISCSSDDNSTTGDIEGEWKADSWHVSGTMEGGSFTMNGIDMSEITVTFNQDGTYISDGEYFTVLVEFSMDGMEFSNEITNDNPFSSGTWQKDGDNLIIKNTGDTEVYNYHIDRLTSNRLDVSLDNYRIVEDGIETTVKAEMGFRR